MDVINFPGYKKWYKENKALWNSRAYGTAQFKLHYRDEDYARTFIKRQEDSYSKKPNLMQILERRIRFILKMVIELMNLQTGFIIFINRLIT